MKKDNKPKMYSSKEAMEYLGLDLAQYKYHVYIAGNLTPDYRFVRNVAFLKETLDTFKARRQTIGLTLNEAAEYLGVDRKWVHKQVHYTKLLVPDGKLGQRLIFTKETLDAIRYLAELHGAIIKQPEPAEPEPVAEPA